MLKPCSITLADGKRLNDLNLIIRSIRWIGNLCMPYEMCYMWPYIDPVLPPKHVQVDWLHSRAGGKIKKYHNLNPCLHTFRIEIRKWNVGIPLFLSRYLFLSTKFYPKNLQVDRENQELATLPDLPHKEEHRHNIKALNVCLSFVSL